MSTEMKSFMTTLDLVMQDKVDPETVIEEDEIEEILTINEEGELQEAYKKGRPRRKGNWPRKIQELTDIRRLSGLEEEVGDNPIATGQYHGELQWSIEGEEDGFQVYIMGPHGWIAQGQPHSTEEEAIEDAKSFWADYNSKSFIK